MNNYLVVVELKYLYFLRNLHFWQAASSRVADIKKRIRIHLNKQNAGDFLSDIKLFSIANDVVTELVGKSMTIEKTLQELIENNLETFLGIRFLSKEYSTGRKHGGRIDTLGLDENNFPVIIEYKRATNENVINQGLFYLEWLLDHKAEFQVLVMEKLGKEISDEIDWTNPRLVCIAGGFTKYDEHAVQLMNRNIELYRYKYYGDRYLLLDLVNATTATTNENVGYSGSSHKPKSMSNQNSFVDNLALIDEDLKNIYESLHDYVVALGDEVQYKQLKFYGAFKRIKNFVCVEAFPRKNAIVIFVKVDASKINFEEGFIRDMANIGHYGTGNVEITLRTQEDLEKAKPFINESFENN